MWKDKTDHADNNWVISSDGAWAKQTTSFLPGPNKNVPPDLPPSLVFKAFPDVVDVPIHYRKPVTGK